MHNPVPVVGPSSVMTRKPFCLNWAVCHHMCDSRTVGLSASTTGRVKQIIGYALLIDRNYDKNTGRGIIYYPMQNKQDTVKVSSGDKSMLLMDIERIKRIILSDKVPWKTASKNCGYCGYLKICGSFD